MFLRPRTLRVLRGMSQQHVRAFGFSSSSGQSPMPPMANIPMPYIEESSERIVCLNGEVNDYMSASIVAQLLWLESDTPEKPITMYINSPGGSVTSGMAIYDTMTYIKSPVSTVCIGGAASMAAILLAGGEAGKRFSLPHSSIMIHQPLGGTRGQASDIMIYANQIQKTREQSNKIMQYHLNKAKGHEKYSLEEINDLMERDKYLTPEEALELGVIDEILTKRPEAEQEKKEAEPDTPKSS
ncbi:ATP-dependent Clp protease, protease subunit [Fusarium austroafricanum]|uniref:ATP-dependent Clp protease proteolytic subunit n=1 Tax=Fusarium austroafricanum TaxID=2364996 RepID=A0A8H4KK44_9HYPO|nr:ATP-dependent Clp protease, protease subunit [Fusarium austroafricanum]